MTLRRNQRCCLFLKIRVAQRQPARHAREASRSCCLGLCSRFELCRCGLHACMRRCRLLEALKQRFGSLKRRVRVQLIRRGAGTRSGEEQHCDRDVNKGGGGRRGLAELDRQSRSVADARNARGSVPGRCGQRIHKSVACVHLLSAALSSSNVRAFAMPAEGKTPTLNEGRARAHAGAQGGDGFSPNAHGGFPPAPHLQTYHLSLTCLLHVHCKGVRALGECL